MKHLICLLILTAAAYGWAESEASSAALTNDCDRVAALNGRTVVEQLVEKLASPEDGEHLSARLCDSVAWLNGKRIMLRGYVAKTESRWFSSGKNIIVTVGRAGEQAVNIKVKCRGGAADCAELKPGQDVVFDGLISGSWDLMNDLVLDDAAPVEVSAYRRLVREAESRMEELRGECLVKELPFGELCRAERFELFEMAKCANAAYPDMELPFGYRPFTRAEWSAAVSGTSYSDDIYSENGYVVFGDGLRGRLFVHRLLDRVVVVWSGCDLSGTQMRLAGGLDFVACAKHLLNGERALQFDQALAVTQGVVSRFKGEVWVVGHSLGGCLATYVASAVKDEEGDRLKFATFNGLGLSSSLAGGLSPEERSACGRRVVNVFCTKDPVYNSHRIARFAGLAPRHFGRSYFLVYKQPEDVAVAEELTWCHGMSEMCRQIGFYCPWYQNLFVVFAGLLVVVLVIALCAVRSFARKSKAK